MTPQTQKSLIEEQVDRAAHLFVHYLTQIDPRLESIDTRAEIREACQAIVDAAVMTVEAK